VLASEQPRQQPPPDGVEREHCSDDGENETHMMKLRWERPLKSGGNNFNRGLRVRQQLRRDRLRG
jgi:hypothetical protein